MSLRKGHIRSGIWAPPKPVDDWRDEAKCAGMMDDMISCDVCVGCPVKEQCGALFDEMDMYLDDGTQRAQPMIGTYGGIEHPDGKARWLASVEAQRTNVGECIADGCERDQLTAHMCNMHYLRERTARIKREAKTV